MCRSVSHPMPAAAGFALQAHCCNFVLCCTSDEWSAGPAVQVNATRSDSSSSSRGEAARQASSVMSYFSLVSIGLLRRTLACLSQRVSMLICVRMRGLVVVMMWVAVHQRCRVINGGRAL